MRKISFSIGEYYHIYNRGAGKSDIFISDSDRKRFMKLLYVCNGTNSVVFKDIKNINFENIDRGETLVDIGAYCLMKNHFHILLREKIENGISIFIQKLLTAYSKYFNKKNNRTGTLFEGPFKATHVDSDEYLKYLFAYIHLNPVKTIDSNWKENGITDDKKIERFLMSYPFSSYIDYIGISREWDKIIDKSSFPEYFSNYEEFHSFIKEWLKFNTNPAKASLW